MSQNRPTPAPGLYLDVPFAEYAGWPAVNASLLKAVAESPAHGLHYTQAPDADTYSRMELRATHALVLEGRAAYEQAFAVWPGPRRGSAWTDYAARMADTGRNIITENEAALVEARAAAVARHEVAASLLSQPGRGRGSAWPEASIVWIDKNTGMVCKGRLDFLRLAMVGKLRVATIADLKTWPSTSARKVSTMVGQQKVHLQMAHYSAGVQAALTAAGITVDRVDCLIIVVEDHAPHDVGVYALHDPAEEGEEPQPGNRGGEKARRVALDTWAECLRTGQYPGRCPDVAPVILPRWAVGAEEEIGVTIEWEETDNA